jgi:hypothetical protein
MLIRDNFPEVGANLIASLSSFDAHNLSHDKVIKIQQIQKSMQR